MAFISYIKRGIKYILFGQPLYNVQANIQLLSPNEQLIGKKVIVTGGGSGIGYSMAKKFHAEGAKVIIAGRNEEKLKRSACEIGCEFLKLDILNVSSFEKFINNADQLLHGVDCLVNNAGISLHETDYSEVTPETFDAQINTNIRGSFFLTQSFVKLLLANNRAGNILFTSSETGETVDERPYGWSKAAINSMVQGLGYKLISNDIRVNAIGPGVTVSDMTGYAEDDNLYSGSSPIGRIYLPEEVAEVACFLLSDASKCVSGQIIYCNNGKTINARWK